MRRNHARYKLGKTIIIALVLGSFTLMPHLYVGATNAGTDISEKTGAITTDKTSDTTQTNTKTLSEKAGFNSVKVSESGIVTLSVSENGNVNNNWYYGDYYDDDDYSSYYPSKCELFRSEKEDGDYKLVTTKELSRKNYDVDMVDNTATSGNVYYYKVRYIDDSTKTTAYGEYSSPLKVAVVTTPGSIKNVRATKAKTFTIKWNSVSGIDGYNIYMKEFDNELLVSLHTYSSLETDGIESNDFVPAEVKSMPYEYVGSVSAEKKSFKYKKASHGKGYLFAIRTYKNVNGEKVESTTMYASHGVMDYYFCYNAENTKFNYKWPKSESQARKACKQITVKVWDFKNHAKHSGAKRSRTLWITVNKKYAATIKQIYKELYKDKSKPPIYEAGSYRWRPEESTWSYHTVGTAIDMNCNENPMYRFTYKKNGKVKKKIIVGSFYKPKSNPYSFPRNGVVEKTFAKYGFVRLENDLMHFNADYVSSSSNY